MIFMNPAIGSTMKLPTPIMRIETLIRMKESSGREKDREDVRHLRQLLENADDAQ
jgi:hypothetical protein